MMAFWRMTLGALSMAFNATESFLVTYYLVICIDAHVLSDCSMIPNTIFLDIYMDDMFNMVWIEDMEGESITDQVLECYY